MVRLLLLSILLAVGCNDRTQPVRPSDRMRTQPDLGVVADAGFDQPVRGLCVPGSQRCVTENSPLLEQCTPTGTSFTRAACGDGEVCREGSCVSFSCVPGRPLCVGATTAAVCDASGQAVENAAPCPDPEVCVGGACVDPCEVARQERSYITCDYTAVDLPNLYQELNETDESPFAIVVANPAPLVPTRVSITVAGNEEVPRPAELREPFTLTPAPSYAVGDATELESHLLLADGSSERITSSQNVEIPPGAAAVFMVRTPPDVFDIASTRPVVAYQFSPYCCNFTATNDASLLLPSSSWGKRYRVVGYPAWRRQSEPWTQAYLSIVADVQTQVRVKAPVDVFVDGERNSEHTFMMEPGKQVLVRTAASAEDERDDPSTDLSGTVIESNSPVGVFAGHPCTFVPVDEWACDHLQEAMLPADILDSRYLLTPVRRRSPYPLDDDRDLREATYWRIVADEATTLTFDPKLSDLNRYAPSNFSSPECEDGLELEPGEFCEFGTTDPTSLAGTGAMIVAGIISGHQSTGVRVYGTQAGDPSMFVLPPVAQFRSSYAFVSPPTFKRTYVTVASAPSAPLTIDGRSIPETERLERTLIELNSQAWEVFTIAIEPGVHTMQAETRFGIVAYAYDDYVSYAFTGGLDLVPKGGAP